MQKPRILEEEKSTIFLNSNGDCWILILEYLTCAVQSSAPHASNYLFLVLCNNVLLVKLLKIIKISY